MIAIRSLNKVRHLLRIQTEIENKTHYDLDEQQKEYFLKQQIKNIREELGEGNASPEKKEILEKAKTKNWSEETAKIFKKEIAKLDTLNQQSPDYSDTDRIPADHGRFALEFLHPGRPQSDPCQAHSEPRPLRHGECKGAHPGIPRRK